MGGKARFIRTAAIGLFLVCTCSLLFSCGTDDDSAVQPNPKTNEELAAEFQELLDDAVARDLAIRGAVMMVDAPLRGLVWKGASGLADSAVQLAMMPDDLFRTASIGKMTCATLAMKLVEAGSFALDDSIYQYLPDSIMDSLHVYQGHDYSRDITIRELMGHRSGLADCIEDGDANVNGLPDFLELLIAEPGRFWTPEETIEYTKEHLPPLFAPGTGFHYSDTNYQLLGLIMQQVSGATLNTLYRDELFGPLEMDHTYMEFYDAPLPSVPGRGLSHVYFQDYDYTEWTSASADWAGGGLASTVEDLSTFIRAFADGGIFQDAQSKAEMLTWGGAGSPGIYYGLGVLRINLGELGVGGVGEIYGHDGFPQSFMFYWPAQSVTIVGTLNQAVTVQVTYDQLVLGVIRLLKH
jgi:CubicO group peptidase (beta-lactamase class C family)